MESTQVDSNMVLCLDGLIAKFDEFNSFTRHRMSRPQHRIEFQPLLPTLSSQLTCSSYCLPNVCVIAAPICVFFFRSLGYDHFLLLCQLLVPLSNAFYSPQPVSNHLRLPALQHYQVGSIAQICCPKVWCLVRSILISRVSSKVALFKSPIIQTFQASRLPQILYNEGPIETNRRAYLMSPKSTYLQLTSEECKS